MGTDGPEAKSLLLAVAGEEIGKSDSSSVITSEISDHEVETVIKCSAISSEFATTAATGSAAGGAAVVATAFTH